MSIAKLSSTALALSLLTLGACADKGPAGGTTASASASAATSAKAAAKKTVTIKRTQDECTFELEAPEELKETAKDGMSFTLSSDSFEFVGFAGAALKSEPTHVLDMYKDEYETAYAGKEGGVLLKVVKPKKPNPKVDKNAEISGMGGEPYASGRGEGCAFNCSGAAAREAEVVAMCKSVKITVAKAEKNAE